MGSRSVSIDEKHVADIPSDAGKVLGVSVWCDEIVVACENGVYLLWMHSGKRELTLLAEALNRPIPVY